MKRKKLRSIWLIPAMAVLMFFHSATKEAVTDGIAQCLQCIIPSLFPFFIITNLIVHSGFPQQAQRVLGKPVTAYLHLPAAGVTAVILGFLGGYPVGAKTAAQLHHQGLISRDEASNLIAVCNNTGPAVFFGLAGSLFFDRGVIPGLLYLIHIVSALLTARLLRPDIAPGTVRHLQNKIPPSVSFPYAVWQSAVACGKISAMVIAFRILLALCEQLLPSMPPVFHAVLAGLLDLPNGILALQQINDAALKFILCSMIINWGGLCVHMQTAAVTASVGIRLTQHLQSKLICTAISGLLCCIGILVCQRRLLGAAICSFVTIIPFFLKSRVAIGVKCRYNNTKVG